ncbi:MAG: hypothetical protein IT376_20390 [Polyangiaceae bacterium]|nr:hypothetical protein [Polyangiaceae bacterium]
MKTPPLPAAIVTLVLAGVAALAWSTGAPRSRPGVAAGSASAGVSRLAAPPGDTRARERSLAAVGDAGDALSRIDRAAAARDRTGAWAAYLDLRRAVRRLGPYAVLAPVAVSQLDPPRAEPRKLLDDVGLRAIGDALLADPPRWTTLVEVLDRTRGPARLASGEVRAASFQDRQVGVSVSRALFDWGALLDGSKAESPQEAQLDALELGRALVTAARDERPALARLTSADARAAERRLERALARFEAWLDRFAESGAGKLEGLRASAELGGAYREAFALTRSETLPPPYAITRGDAVEHGAAVSVASLPARPRKLPDPARTALGVELLFDRRLSTDQSMSCATCHVPERALGSGPTRPNDVRGKRLAREVPTMWNAAYEPMLFWDGRASSLEQQAELATIADMGGHWPTIVERLRADAPLVARFAAAFPEGLTQATVLRAIADAERTLTLDDTPFDRYVRGEDAALDADALAGFDLFYGAARCSRCHRLPVTSGAQPPRFTESEASVVGVPTAPRVRELDPDRGRGALHGWEHLGRAFRVPGLRNLGETAPYFHNGGFATLEEVVDFYADGGGRGLGLEAEGFDPDAARFDATPEQRRQLVGFLREALASPRARATRAGLLALATGRPPPSGEP